MNERITSLLALSRELTEEEKKELETLKKEAEEKQKVQPVSSQEQPVVM